MSGLKGIVDPNGNVHHFDHEYLVGNPTIPAVDNTLTQEGAAADAKKTGDEIAELKSGLSGMTTATASDVGKALKPKTVTDGKVTEWEFGEAGASVELDATLTDPAKAAQAEAVGNKFAEISGIEYRIGYPLKDDRPLSGYKLDSNGYLSSGSGYVIKKYRVIPNETIYLKLSADGETVYDFLTTNVNPSASSGNIVSVVHDAVDGFITVPETANYIYVCQLQSNLTNLICSSESVQTGIVADVKELLDAQEIVYASADLTTSSNVSGSAYTNKIFVSMIPVTDAGLLKVYWMENVASFTSNPVPLTFVICKRTGNTLEIVGKFTALSIPNRVNVFQSDYYVDGNDTYYVGYYGENPSNMGLYSYGWIRSLEEFTSADDITSAVTITIDSNFTTQSLAMYPTVVTTNYGLHAEISTINKEINGNAAMENGKYVHFSVDDCVFWTALIDNENVYTSAFDEPHLALYKSLHDLYGFCITLNVFCVSGNYSIENVPSKFAEEFKANAHWLKFAYHAEDENTYLSNLTVEQAVASYNKFVTGIYTMTGTTDTIDRVTRFGFYDGSLTNTLAIRDCQCGIVGLLCADDTRNSYYLDSTKSEFVRTHAMYRDAENQLVFLNTIRRLEYFTIQDAAQLLTPTYGNVNRYIEFFTHESSNDRFTSFVTWCVTNGYKFGFMQEILRI